VRGRQQEVREIESGGSQQEVREIGSGGSQQEVREIDSAFPTRILADSAFRRARLSSKRMPPLPPRFLDFASHSTRANAA